MEAAIRLQVLGLEAQHIKIFGRRRGLPYAAIDIVVAVKRAAGVLRQRDEFIGSGLSVAPESLEIAFHPDKPKLLSAQTNLIKDVADWSLHGLDIGDTAYTAAITVRETHPTIQLNHF